MEQGEGRVQLRVLLQVRGFAVPWEGAKAVQYSSTAGGGGTGAALGQFQGSCTSSAHTHHNDKLQRAKHGFSHMHQSYPCKTHSPGGLAAKGAHVAHQPMDRSAFEGVTGALCNNSAAQAASMSSVQGRAQRPDCGWKYSTEDCACRNNALEHRLQQS